MVVLLMLGFLAGLSTPAISRYMENLEFRKQVGEILSVLRYARMTAVAKGQPVDLSLDSKDGPALRLAGAVQGLRPAGLGEDSQLTMRPAEIVFYPEGWATPGLLTFTRGKRQRKILIDPLTGLAILD